MKYTAYKCDQCMHHFMGEPPIYDEAVIGVESPVPINRHATTTSMERTFCSEACHSAWRATLYTTDKE